MMLVILAEFGRRQRAGFGKHFFHLYRKHDSLFMGNFAQSPLLTSRILSAKR